MIKVTSVYKDNTYDSNVKIFGDAEKITIELKTLFEAFIQSKNPEVIHAVIAYYLPKITDQLVEGSISESILSHYMDILENCKGGEYKIG